MTGDEAKCISQKIASLNTSTHLTFSLFWSPPPLFANRWENFHNRLAFGLWWKLISRWAAMRLTEIDLPTSAGHRETAGQIPLPKLFPMQSHCQSMGTIKEVPHCDGDDIKSVTTVNNDNAYVNFDRNTSSLQSCIMSETSRSYQSSENRLIYHNIIIRTAIYWFTQNPHKVFRIDKEKRKHWSHVFLTINLNTRQVVYLERQLMRRQHNRVDNFQACNLRRNGNGDGDDDDDLWKAVLEKHSAALRDNFKLSIITGSGSV